MRETEGRDIALDQKVFQLTVAPMNVSNHNDLPFTNIF